MSLLSDMVLETQVATIAYNTATLIDTATGSYLLGADGNWYLSGGLPQHIVSVVGPNGTFKSSIMCGAVCRSASIYSDADVLWNDTEHSIDKDKPRAMRMGEDLTDPTLVTRFKWVSGVTYQIDKFYNLLLELCNKKAANLKEYTVESPFLDVETGKPLIVWKPTYIIIDSFTEFKSEAEAEMLEGDKHKDISETNTAAMVDGNKKTVFTRAVKDLCIKYGIILIVTAHYDKVPNMGMFDITPKDTTFGKQDWKAKGVGSKIKFDASLYLRMTASPLKDEKRYGSDSGQSIDQFEVGVVIERSKTACSGNIIPFVASQNTGLLNAVSNYNYLRVHNKYDGLVGSVQRQHLPVLPDVQVTRNTIKELTDSSYELRRALEIAAQYCFIRNNWRIDSYPFDFSKPATAMLDALMSDKNKEAVSDILNSRGYWTYVKNDRPYMSIFEIMKIAGLSK